MSTQEPTRYPHPGKFEGELALAEWAYQATLDGGSETIGDCSTIGWASSRLDGPFNGDDERAAEEACGPLTDADRAFLRSLAGAIVTETDQGFVSASWYTDKAELEADWLKVEADAAESDDSEE